MQVQSSATPPLATKPSTAVPAVPSSDIYDVSDREKERIAQRVAEAAKAAPEASTTRRTRASQQLNLNSDQARALDDSNRRRDEAMNKLDDLSSTSRPDQPESPTLIPGQTESAARMQPRLTDVSGLDLDDELFANLDDSLDDSHHASEATQTGYRSTDTSSFNIAMFKRRPRQSSVAGRDDGPIRPSSRGQNTPSISSTLNFGNFRRRAREPSILGTARKPRTQRSVSRASQASRNASVLGDGDDSGPDGESTPLHARRQTRGSATEANSAGGSPALPSRKRKSLESHQDGREKRAAVEAAEDEPEEEIHQSIELDIEVERTPSPPRGRALERDRFSTPIQPDDDPDMAPPMSSSSEADSPVAWPSLDTLAHRTYNTRRAPPTARTPEPRDRDSSSDLSSPPSLTHSPNYTAAAAKPAPKKKAAPPQKKVTTADLTSLLPRRRTKASNRASGGSNDPFDLASSDAEDRYEVSAAAADEDEEVSYVDSRASRRRKAPLAKTASNRKAKAPAGGKKRGVRTYGAQEEDKENDEVAEEIVVGSGEEEEGGEEQDGEEEELEAETSQLMRERIGEELQKAVKKFKEVDQWELSFEEVVQGSSPGPDAR